MNDIAVKRVAEAPEVGKRCPDPFLYRKGVASRGHQGVLPAMRWLQAGGRVELHRFRLSSTQVPAIPGAVMKRDFEDDFHDEDVEKYEPTVQEEFIDNMSMKDVFEFFGDISGQYQSELMRAIRAQDEHEVGAVFMQALREYAKDATE